MTGQLKVGRPLIHYVRRSLHWAKFRCVLGNLAKEQEVGVF